MCTVCPAPEFFIYFASILTVPGYVPAGAIYYYTSTRYRVPEYHTGTYIFIYIYNYIIYILYNIIIFI